MREMWMALAVLFFFCGVSVALGPVGPNFGRLFRGIDTLPQDAVVLTRSETRRMFVVTDAYSKGYYDVSNVPFHNAEVREAACAAFVIPCADFNNLSTTPFTFLANPSLRTVDDVVDWVLQEVRKLGGKIVTESKSVGVRRGVIENFGASLPFVTISSAGNNGFDNFFEKRQARFDRDRGIFVSTKTGALITRVEMPELYNIRDAVEARKVIYASHYFIEYGKPLVHEDGCVGVEESCVYVSGWGGTSLASASLGSAMASLLAVFPEYDVFDLSALVSSCAKSYPSLPGGGIVDVPCMIETICAETGSRSSACSVEQHNAAPVLHRQNIGTLENPRPNPELFYTNVSGISAISGWVCDADEVVVEINGEKFRTGYGTTRGDTRKTCGDDDNGFSFLFNWNLLGDGVHTVKAYADDILFASTRVKVTTLGTEFLRGHQDKVALFLPWSFGTHDLMLEWWEPQQNLVISRYLDY